MLFFFKQKTAYELRISDWIRRVLFRSVALAPLDPQHRFKWHDWAEALNLKLRPQPLAAASLYETLDNFRLDGRSGKRFIRPFEKSLRQMFSAPFERRASQSLIRAAAAPPMLSSDSAIAGAVAPHRKSNRLNSRHQCPP